MNSSVIITTYKRPQFLLRAIESVLNQTETTEIIIVDDNGKGSSQQLETEQAISKYKNQIKYFVLENNSGACVARNKGAEISTGKYLFFLDDDDEYLPNKIKTQTQFMKENPKFNGCLSAIRRFDDNGKEIIADSNFPNVGNFKNFVLNGNFFTPMLCMKKSSFQKVGGFKEIPRFQDRFFMLHCLQMKMKFQGLSEPLYIMNEHNLDRITNESVEKTINSLQIINNFISNHKNQFTSDELKQIQVKNYKTIATAYYLTKKNRVQSAFYWYKTFLLNYKRRELLMVVKSFLKP